MWMPYEIPMIDPNFIKPKLNVMPKALSVKQRGRRLAAEHVDVVIEKVDKLEEATKILYLSWLSNMVVVNKKNGKYRVCQFHKS